MCVCVVGEGREKKSVGTAQRAGRVSLTQSVNADDMQSALTTALVSQSVCVIAVVFICLSYSQLIAVYVGCVLSHEHYSCLWQMHPVT